MTHNSLQLIVAREQDHAESGESWAPMACAVMGGLTVATALTLVVTPVIYASVEILAGKLHSKREEIFKVKYENSVMPDQKT
ncbi:MAG: hypothetical protein P8X42_03565 [Calditrichaceae bacterium]|jgi:type IV secretory pathway VirB2 component (pilin)